MEMASRGNNRKKDTFWQIYIFKRRFRYRWPFLLPKLPIICGAVHQESEAGIRS